MPIETTAGMYVVNHKLPKELRDYDRVFDGKTLAAFLSRVAKERPDDYRDIAQHLLRAGRMTSARTTSYSFGPEHIRKAAIARTMTAQLQREVEAIYRDEKLTDKQRDDKIVALLSGKYDELNSAVMKESLAEQNPLALQAASGVRGKAMNLNSIRGADLLYTDAQRRPMPIPILHSYGEGLSPVEYYAGSFGARQGLAEAKLCLGADTEVLMADWSVKKICDIQIGDMVMGADMECRSFPVRVTNVFQNGTRYCNKYTFRMSGARTSDEQGAYDVVCTPDHQFLMLARDGKMSPVAKRPVRQLALLAGTARVNSRYIMALSVVGDLDLDDDTAEPTGPNAEFAYALGVAYGCRFSDAYAPDVALMVADHDAVVDVNLRLQPVGLEMMPVPHSLKQHLLLPIEGQDAVAHRVLSLIKSRITSVPRTEVDFNHDEMRQWNGRAVRDFLSGFLAVSGAVSSVRQRNDVRTSILLTHQSEKLLNSLRELLRRRMGVFCASVNRRATGTANVYWTYTLAIASLYSLTRIVRYCDLAGRKRQVSSVLQTETSDPNRQRIPSFYLDGTADVGEVETYDIEVDHPDHMFVLASGLISSNSVGDAGYLAKLLQQATHRLVVTQEDQDKYDAAQPQGLPVDTDDQDSVGALLAADVGPYKRNTTITSKILNDLNAMGHKEILIRSPITSMSPGGGVYARDVGMTDRQRMPTVGENPGLVASSALAEPLTQMTLSAKHSGGVAAAVSAGPTGFRLVDVLVNVPASFRGAAAHAQKDGVVGTIRPAPQGGNYVTIDGQDHYVAHGHDLKVKPGDTVEAGDLISSGVPSPAEFVKHKGIGEGARQFVYAFRDAYRTSNHKADRRNIEMLARGMINHVELDQEHDQYVPGDIVPYASLATSYQPRQGHKVVAPREAKGLYLERPVLHYSIGTQLRPSVLKRLEDFGVKSIVAHSEPPPFRPVMVRAAENMTHDPDWMSRFLGSYLKRGLLEAAHRNMPSDENSTSFVPGLARSRDFGQQGVFKGTSVPYNQPLPQAPPGPVDLTTGSHEETPPVTTPTTSILKAALLDDQQTSKQANAGHNMGDTFSPLRRNDPPTSAAKIVQKQLRLDDDARGVLGKFLLEYPAGTSRVLVDDYDDDDNPLDDYPLQHITYPVDYGTLAGYFGEDNEDLDVLKGTATTAGLFGVFQVFRPDVPIGYETKFFVMLKGHELVACLRAYEPVLRPESLVVFDSIDEFKAVLAMYKNKKGVAVYDDGI